MKLRDEHIVFIAHVIMTFLIFVYIIIGEFEKNHYKEKIQQLEIQITTLKGELSQKVLYERSE